MYNVLFSQEISQETELFKFVEFYFEGGLEMAIHW